jgi:hypothetical protein
MSDRPEFTMEIYQNPYLPVDGTQIHAIAQVRAEGDAALLAAGSPAAEIIIVDVSSSMAGARLVAAKRAAKAAVDALREDVDFAVVAGSHEAVMVYPRDRLLAPATAARKADAHAAISRLSAAGGTRIGHWLDLASALFGEYRRRIRHAVLLTDGKNEHESPEELDAALERCAGRFVCDCRGIGADPEPAELRKVATGLLGGFDLIVDPGDLAADFRRMIERAMGKAAADVTLRVWTPHNVALRSVKQVYPSIRDLGGDATGTGARPVGPTTDDHPTGIWGVEHRDYHFWLTVPPGEPGQSLLAARVSVVLPGPAGEPDHTVAEGRVLARWTDDEAQSTRRHPAVVHYAKLERLADASLSLRRAHEAGDEEAAAAEHRQASRLAEETGSVKMSRALDRLADPATGAIRPRREIGAADIKVVDTMASEAAQPPPGKESGAGDDEDEGGA